MCAPLAGIEPATYDIVRASLYPLSYSGTQSGNYFALQISFRYLLTLWINMVVAFMKSEHRKIELQDEDLARNGGVFFRWVQEVLVIRV